MNIEIVDSFFDLMQKLLTLLEGIRKVVGQIYFFLLL